MNDYLATLREMRDKALQGGGADRIMQLHSSGKLTARQQLTLLLDAGSFQELDALATHNISDFGMAEQRFPGDGVVTSFGRDGYLSNYSAIASDPIGSHGYR